MGYWELIFITKLRFGYSQKDVVFVINYIELILNISEKLKFEEHE